MKRKAKKSKAKKSKSSINIEIKNIVKQVQNEQKKDYDYVQYRKDPKRNFELGSYSRLQNPSISYASTPLSNFPSLSSLVSAPVPSQLKSHHAEYRPDVLKVETNLLDIEPSKASSVLIKPQPVVSQSASAFASYKPTVHELLRPISMTPELRSSSVSELEEKEKMDESELLVSEAMDQHARDLDMILAERTLPPTPSTPAISSSQSQSPFQAFSRPRPRSDKSDVELSSKRIVERKDFLLEMNLDELKRIMSQYQLPLKNKKVAKDRLVQLILDYEFSNSKGLARGGSVFY